MSYVIYTKPKCMYCDMLKDVLKNVEPQPKWIDATSYLENEKSKKFFLDFIRDSGNLHSHYTTFPMVFYDSVFLGGYTETKIFHELSEVQKKQLLIDKYKELK